MSRTKEVRAQLGSELTVRNRVEMFTSQHQTLEGRQSVSNGCRKSGLRSKERQGPLSVERNRLRGV